jgi:Tfp pilus assembly protein PilO
LKNYQNTKSRKKMKTLLYPVKKLVSSSGLQFFFVKTLKPLKNMIKAKYAKTLPRNVSSAGGLEDHGAAVYTLSNCGLAEASVCEEDGAPREALGDSG